MKKSIVRFAALYVFNTAALLLIGALFPQVRVGLNALWAAVVLTAATLFLKPALRRMLGGLAEKRAAGALAQYGLVYVAELIVWILTVLLSGVRVYGLFWGYALPPLVLLAGWVIYDRIDDRIEAKASQVYDSVQSRMGSNTTGPASPSAPESPATGAGRAELHDGLTPEQRRMLDEL